MSEIDSKRPLKLYRRVSHPVGEPEKTNHLFLTPDPAPDHTKQGTKITTEEADDVLALNDEVEIADGPMGRTYFAIGVDDDVTEIDFSNQFTEDHALIRIDPYAIGRLEGKGLVEVREKENDDIVTDLAD